VRGKHPNYAIFTPLVLLSIPWAIGIHTVTAFLYNGLAARPFWNSAILAPRFIASALCSGPAVLLVLMQLLRRFTRFEIQDAAIWKIAELMAYAMAVNLFLLGAEVFKEFYSGTEHVIHMQYMFTGVERSQRDRSVHVDRGRVLDHRVPVVPRAEDAQEPDHAQHRLPADLLRRLHREGRGPRDPGDDSGHARRDLRVPAVEHRAHGRRRASSPSASCSSR
jgi:hypothetical protein